MYKLKRSKRTLWGQQGNVCDSCENLGRETKDNSGSNKRDFRADVLSLLSSALRPRLLGAVGILVIILMKLGFTMPVAATSLTLTIPDNLSMNIDPNSETFKESDTSKFNVKTDAYAGFTLNIKALDDNKLKNSVRNTVINSISQESGLTAAEFSNSAPTNSWGFKSSKYNGSENENNQYYPGPTSNDTLIDKTSVANNTSGVSYDLNYAVKVDNTLASGEYKNTFVFTALANPMPYKITYDLNYGSGGPQPNPQVGSTSNTSIPVTQAQPTRSYYEFQGWCDTKTIAPTCPTKSYKANDPLSITNGPNEITLYVVWKTTAPSIQSWSCNSLSTNQTATLSDSRDNNNYIVAKLLDGKCWMTENLRIQDKVLTSSDSNVSASYTLPASNTTNFIESNAEKALVYIDEKLENGGYYSWIAAVAGSTVYKSNQSPTTSICPKGWHLPTNIEYRTLFSRYSIQTIQQAPSNFIATGLFRDDELRAVGTDGNWWSSTYAGTSFGNEARHAYTHTTTNELAYDGRSSFYKGFNVRCVKD